MRYTIKPFVLLFAIVIMLFSCGGGKEKGALGDKKAQLEKLKTDQKKIADQITKVEDEIAKLDPASVKAKLISVETIGSNAFDHYIDLQGSIDARNSAFAAPKGSGGVVRALYVKEGDVVKKGQTIAKLDDAMARQQLIAAEQQTGQVRAQLKLAQTTYQRQQNLWSSNIGTEMQVISAKANVEGLTAQLKAMEAQAGSAREQVNYSNVVAEIGGTVDKVDVKVGEVLSPALQQISIVNTGNLKIVVNVPETYLNNVKVGSPLIITLPEANNKKINTKASVVSKAINPDSRSFYLEAGIPNDPAIRANQIAKVQILDYTRPDAVTVPLNVLQTDQQGKYIMVAVQENGKLIARKKRVLVGQLYGDRLEIKTGLINGDNIITEGFQNVYEGQIIITAAK